MPESRSLPAEVQRKCRAASRCQRGCLVPLPPGTPAPRRVLYKMPQGSLILMPPHFSGSLTVKYLPPGQGHISSHMSCFLYFKCKPRVILVPFILGCDSETKNIFRRSWNEFLNCSGVSWFQFTGDKGPEAPTLLSEVHLEFDMVTGAGGGHQTTENVFV